LNIDAFAEAAEGGEEPPRPGSVPVTKVLAGPLHSVVTACGTLRPASVGGGECQVFERPTYAVLGGVAEYVNNAGALSK
jgi:hypothetical protein